MSLINQQLISHDQGPPTQSNLEHRLIIVLLELLQGTWQCQNWPPWWAKCAMQPVWLSITQLTCHCYAFDFDSSKSVIEYCCSVNMPHAVTVQQHRLVQFNGMGNLRRGWPPPRFWAALNCQLNPPTHWRRLCVLWTSTAAVRVRSSHFLQLHRLSVGWSIVKLFWWNV